MIASVKTVKAAAQLICHDLPNKYNIIEYDIIEYNII